MLVALFRYPDAAVTDAAAGMTVLRPGDRVLLTLTDRSEAGRRRADDILRLVVQHPEDRP